MRLTDEQIELYSRQIILREVGGVGQSALRAARALAFGRGAAHEACVSYLVGAGWGAVDLLQPGATPDPARTLPLPEPGTRTADACVRSLDDDDELDVAAYDVALDLDPWTSQRTALGKLGLHGRPRLGSIVLRADPTGGLHLALLPRDHGCIACVTAEPATGGTNDEHAGAIACASAGALAALACCRWVLGIGSDTGARVLRLPPGSAVWAEAPPPRRASCPRGCPPPAHPV